jgi:hypothetical protein
MTFSHIAKLLPLHAPQIALKFSNVLRGEWNSSEAVSPLSKRAGLEVREHEHIDRRTS